MRTHPDGRGLILIGLDGATFDVLEPYFRRGALPVMASMAVAGVRGTLRSSIPPVTGPAWVSFMTGMRPGRHGIFDFVKRVPGGVRRRPITHRDIRARTVWEILNDAGRTVGLANLPVTFPPPPLDGFVIPGLLTPSTEGEFAHPAGIMDEVRGAIGDYVLDVWWQHHGEKGVEEFLDRLLHCTEQRARAFHHLLRAHAPDVFMGVFIGSDRVQHYLWPYIHPARPSDLTAREREYVARIEQYYARVDSFLGELIEEHGERADVVLVSDHGFGPLRKKMFVNRWLAERGYLAVDRRRSLLMAARRGVLGPARRVVRALDVLDLRRKLLGPGGQRGRLRGYNFLDCIDWSRTRAYSASQTEQGIYLNVAGREPGGIVERGAEYEALREEIIASLRDLRDPDTGEPLVSEIHRREELYDGPHASEAPDIVLFLAGGEVLLDVQLGGRLFRDAGWWSGFGTHRMDGVLLARGPSCATGAALQGADLVDLAPTILYHQGLPIPREMQGRPLLELFHDEIQRSRLVERVEGEGTVEAAEDEVLTAAQQQEIEDRLRKLGYLSE